MLIEVSHGEIIDKFTILQLKLQHATQEKQVENIKKEHDYLKIPAEKILPLDHQLVTDLYQINQKLWNTEDLVREKEMMQDFGKEFVVLARRVYIDNDERAKIKKQINILTQSKFIEEKVYLIDQSG